MHHAKGVRTSMTSTRLGRIAKCDDHLDKVCVRVEHHRTITIREATYAHCFKRVPQNADLAVAGWT